MSGTASRSGDVTGPAQSHSSLDCDLETYSRLPLAEEREELAFDLEPHEGHVYLNRPAGDARTYLIPALTLERVLLPPGKWELTVEDGFTALEDEDENVLLAEDLLKRKLGRRGRDFAVMDKTCSPPREWCLSSKMREYEPITLQFRSGSTSARDSMQCFLLSWPRQRSRIYISVASVYRVLSFTSYGGMPSRWAFRNHPSWRNHFKDMGFGPQHYLHSDKVDPPRQEVERRGGTPFLARLGP